MSKNQIHKQFVTFCQLNQIHTNVPTICHLLSINNPWPFFQHFLSTINQNQSITFYQLFFFQHHHKTKKIPNTKYTSNLSTKFKPIKQPAEYKLALQYILSTIYKLTTKQPIKYKMLAKYPDNPKYIIKCQHQCTYPKKWCQWHHLAKHICLAPFRCAKWLEIAWDKFRLMKKWPNSNGRSSVGASATN